MWHFDRDIIWGLPGVGWLLWTLGGTNAGKWIRRFLWPLIVVTIAIVYGTAWYLACLSGVLGIIVHSLGYSPERTSILRRVLIAVGFGLWLLPILIPHWWVVLVSTGVIACTFFASLQLSLHANWWTHKWTEGLVGFLQGAIVAYALLRG